MLLRVCLLEIVYFEWLNSSLRICFLNTTAASMENNVNYSFLQETRCKYVFPIDPGNNENQLTHQQRLQDFHFLTNISTRNVSHLYSTYNCSEFVLHIQFLFLKCKMFCQTFMKSNRIWEYWVFLLVDIRGKKILNERFWDSRLNHTTQKQAQISRLVLWRHSCEIWHETRISIV